MHRSRILPAAMAVVLVTALLPATAKAQYGPPPQRPGAFVLGTAHVDGLTDHDDIKVGRHDGTFHFVQLRVRYAPIQFDHVVIHYGNGTAETLRIRTYIGPGHHTRWIALPGGERVIQSLELWYARAEPNNPTKPEVVLFGAP